MSYCPKCGEKVTEDMTFCPKCGASLKVEAAAPPKHAERTYEKSESREKQEKREKGEKNEKREKGEVGLIGPIIGGLVLIFLGLAFYLQMVMPVQSRQWLGALFFVVIGIIIIIGAIYGAMAASRRHPRT